MKKLLAFLLAFSMFSTVASADIMLEYNGEQHNYTGSLYKLEVNGKEVATPLEPIIFNDRALVPVREVFEAMGAVVTYIDDTREIVVNMDETTVTMQIDSPNVTVNDVQQQIPDGVVPMLIAKAGEDAKTMVPVRFVSESMGMNVVFDGANGVIRINNSDFSPETSTITSINTDKTGSDTVINVKLSSPAQDISTLTMVKNSGVLYCDLYGTSYAVSSNISVDSDLVKSIRLGIHEEGYSRIAIDTANVMSYSKSLSEDGTLLTITVKGIGAYLDPPSTPSSPGVPTPTPLAHLTGEKIVVLDAGHGGSDPGAVYDHGDVKIEEKIINLSVTKKVEAILIEHGVRVELTRWNDTAIPLGDRPDFANKHGAAIFVSIHSNSFADKTSVNGIEVFYSKTNNYDNYGITSKELASDIYKNLIAATGASQRGVKTEQHKVTRTSEMPAALIELGFITNREEGMKLYTAEYQDKLAGAIADAILENLQSVKIPPDPIVRTE